MNHTRRAVLVGLAAAGIFVIAGAASCDKYTEPYRDAPRGTTNTGTADVFTMPDGFSNGASKCDHGNRVYVAYHGNSRYAAIAVVPADPTCNGAAR